MALPALITSHSLGQWSYNSVQQREYRERILRSATAIREAAVTSDIAKTNLIDTGKCGTPLQMEISRLWQSFSPQAKAQLLLASARPTTQTNRLSPNGFFRVHYDTTGSNAPALLDALGQRIGGTYHDYADSAASAFERSREVEVNILGYLQPPDDGMVGGGLEYDIYIRNLPSILFGQTLWIGEEPIDVSRENFTTRSYIEVDNDYQGYRTSGLAGLRVTAAHELHHAIQAGNYGLWPNSEFYFYELTSTWMEEMVFDGVNDYYFDLPLYFNNTGIPFNLTGVLPEDGISYFGYERSIWGVFLTKRHGSAVMRRTWEEMVNVRSLDALERALNEFGDTFPQSFAEFILWNFFTAFRASGGLYYDEAVNYPSVRIRSQLDLSSGTGRITSTTKPLSSQYHQVVTSADTVTLIVVNRDIQSAKDQEFFNFQYTYDLATSDQGSAFLKLPNDVRVRFNTENSSLWQTVFLVNNVIATELDTEVDLYPNPFILNGLDVLVIPVDNDPNEEVTLYIFTSNFELVYSNNLQPISFLGRIAVTWNGKNNNGGDVSSGIYFYAIQSERGTSKGKFAVIQR